jgi:predicted  nucleic acid-binding Zn-ribbon protein
VRLTSQGKIVITKEDAMAFVKQLEELKADANRIDAIKEVRGPNDLTRRIDELKKENTMLQDKIKRLQKIMMEQFRNKGAL